LICNHPLISVNMNFSAKGARNNKSGDLWQAGGVQTLYADRNWRVRQRAGSEGRREGALSLIAAASLSRREHERVIREQSRLFLSCPAPTSPADAEDQAPPQPPSSPPPQRDERAQAPRGQRHQRQRPPAPPPPVHRQGAPDSGARIGFRRSRWILRKG